MFYRASVLDLATRAESISAQGVWQPVVAQLFPTDRCAHRCTFCISERYRGDAKLPVRTIISILDDLVDVGTRVVEFCGGGEPTQHPDIAAVLKHATQLGLEVQLTTNGSRLHGDLIEDVAGACTSIKVSLDAATSGTYRAVHRVPSAVFFRVIEALRRLCDFRDGKSTLQTVEISFVLSEHNYRDASAVIDLADDIGVDFLTVSTDSLRLPDSTARRAIETVSSQQSKRRALVRTVWSTPDELVENTDLPCPLVTSYICVTASGGVFPSCHHVSFPDLALAQLDLRPERHVLGRVLNDPRVLAQLGQYAFGVGSKLNKLLASDANMALVRHISRTARRDLLVQPAL